MAHLVEIDLLRGGIHTTAVPREHLRRKVPVCDYHVCVHRYDRFEDYAVYAFRLQDRLPTVAIPLLPGDGDIAVDLQAVFDRCYDGGPYRREIDYTTERPEPALTPEQSQWARQRLGLPAGKGS